MSNNDIEYIQTELKKAQETLLFYRQSDGVTMDIFDACVFRVAELERRLKKISRKRLH